MQSFLFLVLILAGWQAATAAAAAAAPEAPESLAAGRTVNATSGADMWAALADEGVSVVQLLDDVHLTGADSTGHGWTPSHPLLRRSAITLRSFCGDSSSECDIKDYKTVDFGFLSGLVLLDYNVTMEFRSFAAASFRRGAGVGIDSLLGRKGSHVHFHDVLFKRLSCSPSSFQLQALAQQAGSSSVTVLDHDVCWQGKCYSGAMHYVNYTVQVQPSEAGFSSVSVYGGDTGYEMVITNTTRLCDSYWPESCMEKMTSDQCNEYYTNLALQQQQPGLSQTTRIAIAVCVFVSIAALVAGCVLYACRWRRRVLRRAETASHYHAKDVESGSLESSALDAFRLSGPSKKSGSSWQLVASNSNARNDGMSAPPGDDVELGVLVGTGSYGRVYRGRWRSPEGTLRDVAVKVMEHNIKMAVAMANEASLMMSFDHRNIVRAFHVLSWRQQSKEDTATQHATRHTNSDHSSLTQSPNTSAAAAPSTPHGTDILTTARDSNGDSTVKQHSTGSAGSGSSSSAQETAATAAAASDSDAGVKGKGKSVQQPGSSSTNGTPLRGADGSCMVVCHSPELNSTDYETSTFGWGTGNTASGGTRCMAGGANGNDRCDGLARTWLIQEFCEGGALSDVVRAGRNLGSDGKPIMAKVLTQLRDIAAGMRYLHSCKVIHRDLKACNVLLAHDPTAPFGEVAKVADFGLSRIMQQGKTQFSTCTLGTMSHMSPELLRAGKQSLAADVYAFGIVMWEVVSAGDSSPFGHAHYGAVFERVAINGERPALSPELAEIVGEEYLLLMHLCWHAEASMRPTFEQVCEALEHLLAKCSKERQTQTSSLGSMGTAGAVSRSKSAGGAQAEAVLEGESDEPGSAGAPGLSRAKSLARTSASPYVCGWDE